MLGLRPEALELAPGGIDARVEVVEEIGADAYVFCVADYRGEPVKLVARTETRRAPEREARVSLLPARRRGARLRRRDGRPAGAGARFVSLDIATPAAVVDLDRLEANLARWQAHCDRVGLANRPHVKTHKCVEIARRQVELGAAGVTCQTLREAEVMVDAGIDDVLVPYNLVGGRKLERLAQLLRRARIAVTADDAAAARRARRRAADAAGASSPCSSTATPASAGRGSPRREEAAALAGGDRAHATACGSTVSCTYPAPPGAREFLEAAAARRRGCRSRRSRRAGRRRCGAPASCVRSLPSTGPARTSFNDRNSVAAGAASLARGAR